VQSFEAAVTNLGATVGRSLSGLRRRLLGIAVEETGFVRRGFRGGDASTRQHIEAIGRAFLHGYHAALEEGRPDRLASRLDEQEPMLRGFSFEGAGMALYLLDRLTPWNRGRFREFLAGPGFAHAYMVYVGAGWAMAQLRLRVERPLAQLDPLLGWLAIDGYGFHQGYFRWKQTVDRHWVPDRLSGYARRVFDQGLGRSLWFVEGAEPMRIEHTISGFAAPRRADLWSGVGLACAYAGGIPGEAIEQLSAMAGPYHSHLAQGVAFAAKARQRAGNLASHTELASRMICGMSAEEAAGLTDEALADLTEGDGLPSYEVWRSRIRANWIEEAVTS
jgi:enediyne biosynthesis protein E3